MNKYRLASIYLQGERFGYVTATRYILLHCYYRHFKRTQHFRMLCFPSTSKLAVQSKLLKKCHFIFVNTQKKKFRYRRIVSAALEQASFIMQKLKIHHLINKVMDDLPTCKVQVLRKCNTNVPNYQYPYFTPYKTYCYHERQ